MDTDVLGAPFEQMTIDLPDDDQGKVVATLIRRRAEGSGTGHTIDRAVLYVHGFTDYFFQTHLADFYAAQGIDFYAIDLRKHGRSLLPHQTPNYIRDVDDYFAELDIAMAYIREIDGHSRVLVNGHSTGGLIAALWADRRRADDVIDAAFLNSPFFEFNVPAITRTLGGPAFAAIARSRPYALIPAGLNEVYGQSIHADHNGEWRYDLEWKPLGGFPIRVGWITAIRKAQARLQAGLNIACPVFVGMSHARYRSTKWSESAHEADAVLDPAHMARYAAGLGRHVTVVRFEGARHDLMLSRKPIRDAVLAEHTAWMRAYFTDGEG